MFSPGEVRGNDTTGCIVETTQNDPMPRVISERSNSQWRRGFLGTHALQLITAAYAVARNVNLSLWLLWSSKTCVNYGLEK